MKYSRELNRFDEKWAHPEELEEDSYKIRHDFSMTLANVGKPADEVDRANDFWRKPIFDLFMGDHGEYENAHFAWRQEYTAHGCPQEPETKARLLIRKPNDMAPGEKLPCILYLSGGGLMIGVPETALELATGAVDRAGIRCVMVLPEYRAAPPYPYPAAINDLEAVYQWILETADDLGIDRNRIVIAGGSTGGQMALCLTFRLKGARYYGQMPRGIVAMEPVMDDVSANDSFRISFEDAEGNLNGWDVHGCRTGFKLWLGERYGDPSLPPEAVPNRATLEDVRGFPPVWMPSCAELDPSRDSAYQFAQLLHKAEIFCDFHEWGGCSHLLSGGPGEEPLARRIRATIEGALSDAVTYDFRRTWLEGDA